MGANAQSLPREVAARAEIYPIPSFTLSDQQFLSGDAAAGKPVTVAGELRIAQGTGKLPVVVLMHGSGGMGADSTAWSRDVQRHGRVDLRDRRLHRPRVDSVSANQAQLGRLNFILDIYGALAILAKHPRVDPQRIVLMGFSRGGQAALYASLDALPQALEQVGRRVRGLHSVLSGLLDELHRRHRRRRAPIRIFHGIADDYNPWRRCKAFVERLRRPAATWC